MIATIIFETRNLSSIAAHMERIGIFVEEVSIKTVNIISHIRRIDYTRFNRVIFVCRRIERIGKYFRYF